MLEQEFSQGETYQGFVVDRITPIEEVDLLVYELTHVHSGAKVVHIANKEVENLFCISFRTYPSHNKGVPHILEHTVLCGSKKFDVKDPFFAMSRRSLATFMNALTGNNFTAYPASTTHEKDFYNLLDVYIDAVFFPRLRKESFMQEGCRFEFKDKNDPNSDLVAKGIVFNEMQGALSRMESRLWRDVLKNMFPNHTNGYHAGGDPIEILDLTYEELIAYHKEYYSAGNAIFFFNGSLPLKGHLDFIEDKVLKEAPHTPAKPPVKLVARFKEPRRSHSYYPSQEKDTSRSTYITFGWLTTEISNLEDWVALSLLDSVLMDNDASLLKKTLLSSGFCTQADSILDTEMREIPYFIVCQGCNVDNANELEKLLLKRLKEISLERIDPKLIESAMYQLEFSRSEITGDQGPFGLELYYRTILSAQQGGDIIPNLQIHSLFEKIAKTIIDPGFFSKIISKYFLSNTHFIRHTLEPDPEVHNREQKAIDDLIKEKSTRLSAEEKANISQEIATFSYYQQGLKDNTDCLPRLHVSDIPKEILHYELERDYVDQLTVYRHNCNTNGITYASLSFDLPQFDSKDLPYVRLFSTMITEIGVSGKNYMETLEFVQENLGEIHADLSLNIDAQDTTNSNPTFTLHARALNRKIPMIFTHMKDVILTADFTDKERMKELILQQYTDLQQQLNRSASAYAVYRSKAGLNQFANVLNEWHGLPYFTFMRNLATNIDKSLDEIIEKLETIQRTLFHLNSPNLILTCDDSALCTLQANQWFGLNKFSTSPYSPWIDFALPMTVYSAAKQMPVQVASNAMALDTVSYKHPNSAALNLAAILFENVVLHRKVREECGAYGCGAELSPITGLFHFYSVRDPHIFSTHQSIMTAAQEIADGNFSEDDLIDAKLSYFQEADAPLSPGSRGSWTYFLQKSGLNKETRQKYREQIIEATKQSVATAVKDSILPKMNEAIWTSFAKDSLVERENKLFSKAGLPVIPLEKI